jgi:dihydrofolate synthase/folylpolyglutamate synthase
MHLLGASLSDIAREKAGIIKPGVPVIVSPQQYEVEGVLAAIAESRGSPYFRVGRDWHFSAGNHDLHGQSLYIWSREEQPLMDSYIEAAGEEEWVPPRYRIQLLGYHQVVNAATAYAALSVLRVHGVRVREVEIREGFWKAQWPGRFQILSMDPALVVDSAHNRDSALKLRIALDDYYPGQQVTLIFGASADKDISGMLSELVPRMSRIIVTQASHPRAAEPEVLAEHARSYSMHVREAVPVKAALECALEQARPDEVVLAAGSIFVVGDILSAWQEVLGRVGAPDGQEET